MGPGMILNRRALVTSESGRSLWGSRSCGNSCPFKGSPQKDDSIPGKLFFLKICDWRSIAEHQKNAGHLVGIAKRWVGESLTPAWCSSQFWQCGKASRVSRGIPHEAPWGNMESSWKWWFPILAREPKKTCEIPWIIFLQGVYRHRFAGYLRVSNTIIRVFEFLKENFHYPLCWNGFEKPLQLLGYGRFVSSLVGETVGSFSPEN